MVLMSSKLRSLVRPNLEILMFDWLTIEVLVSKLVESSSLSDVLTVMSKL